jgi:ribosomal protein S6
MTTKDLARKIDAYRNLADYVLLTPKEAKRVVTELRRAARLQAKMQRVKTITIEVNSHNVVPKIEELLEYVK